MEGSLSKWISRLSFWFMLFFLAVFIAGEFAVKGIGNFWFSEDFISLFFVKILGILIGIYVISIIFLKSNFIKNGFHKSLISLILMESSLIASAEQFSLFLGLLFKIILIGGPIFVIYNVNKYQDIHLKWYHYLIFIIISFLAYSSFSPIKINDGLYFGL